MSFDTGADGGQEMPQEDRFESMGVAIYAYELGHIGFLDLIHQVGEMLGLPPLEFTHEVDPGTKTA